MLAVANCYLMAIPRSEFQPGFSAGLFSFMVREIVDWFTALTVRASHLMRYKVKSIAALQIALGGLPDKMRVEVDPGIQVSAKTVRELRKMTAWPENLAVTTPQERHADSAVKISRLTVATRTAPKT
jgi:hypothetical protein